MHLKYPEKTAHTSAWPVKATVRYLSTQCWGLHSNKFPHLHFLSSGQGPLIGTHHSLLDVLIHKWILTGTRHCGRLGSNAGHYWQGHLVQAVTRETGVIHLHGIMNGVCMCLYACTYDGVRGHIKAERYQWFPATPLQLTTHRHVSPPLP